MQLVNIYGGVMTYFAGSHDEELPEIVFNNGIIEFMDHRDSDTKSSAKSGAYEDEELLRKNWDMFRDLGFENIGTINVDTSKYGADRITVNRIDGPNKATKKRGSKEHIKDSESDNEEELGNKVDDEVVESKEEGDIERGLINIAGQTTGIVEAMPVTGLLTEFADDAAIAARALLVAAAYESTNNESTNNESTKNGGTEDMSEDTFDSFMADYPEEYDGSCDCDHYGSEEHEEYDDFFTTDDDNDGAEIIGGLGDSEKYDPNNFMYNRDEICGCTDTENKLGGLDSYLEEDQQILEARSNCIPNGGRKGCLGSFEGEVEEMPEYFIDPVNENDYDEEYDFYD